MQFSSIWPIDKVLSGATTPSQSRAGNDGNEGVLHIPPNSSITETSPSDCLVSYLGHSLEGSYSSAKVQSVYFTAPADWAIQVRVNLGVIAMKVYTTFPRYSELESHHRMQYNGDTFSYPSVGNIVSIFYTPPTRQLNEREHYIKPHPNIIFR